MVSLKKFRDLLAFTAVLLCCAAGYSQERQLDATLEREVVTLGNSVYLNVVFYGTDNVEAPIISTVDGLNIKYINSFKDTYFEKGASGVKTTFSYLVMPLKPGNYKIGPFVLSSKSEKFAAAPVNLIVAEADDMTPARPQPPSGGASAPTNKNPSTDKVAPRAYRGDNAFLVLEGPAPEIFQNEILKVRMKIYVKEMGLKNISFPSFVQNNGFSIGEWNEPHQAQEVYNGQLYNTLEFFVDISGVKEGEYVLGPAVTACDAIMQKRVQRGGSSFGRSVFDDSFFSSTFGQVETYPIELESNVLKFKVLPFPQDGKPESFDGAVGSYRMDVSVTAKQIKLGEPINLNVAITGDGNFATVHEPAVEVSDDMKAYEPEITKKDRAKIYKQIILPKT
ncbi:MAG: BatD family protein, partial [Candidatus Omnitrophica bacterium]|nr:BatD family protein [Candidatus Omnitrophota bacterium]